MPKGRAKTKAEVIEAAQAWGTCSSCGRDRVLYESSGSKEILVSTHRYFNRAMAEMVPCRGGTHPPAATAPLATFSEAGAS